MASAIAHETQHLNGDGGIDVGLCSNGSKNNNNVHAPASPTQGGAEPAAIVKTPPSPPTTDTDTTPGSPQAGQQLDGPSTSSRPNDTNVREGGGSPLNNDSPIVSPVTSPPYWLNAHTFASSHARNSSTTSVDSIPPGGIVLQDNENSRYSQDRNAACWAKSVEVTDFVIVNGSTTNIGAFVVWNIRVETLTGSYMNIRKRYSEFDDFRWRLVRTFPNFEAAVPELPPKSLISRFRANFLEKRRAGLQYFLNCILLNPEFSGSPVLKDFLFS